ncbi:hypothetical protein RB595_006225 [Gaeumannomyces hyphopodioides]
MAPHAPNAPSPQLPRHTVIVGGGIVGAATLFFSARHPTRSRAAGRSKLTLLEASRELAPGASGKAGGFLAVDWHGEATASLAKLSFELHRQLAAEGGGATRWGYRDVETLQVNFDTATKSSSECPKELNWINPDIVASAKKLGGGGSTSQVTPKCLVEYLVEEARKQEGVDVRLGTSVIALDTTGDGRVKGLRVRKSGGKEELIECDRVVVAAGPWTGSLLRALVPDWSARIPLELLQKGKSIDGSRAHSLVIRGKLPTTAHCLFTDLKYTADDGSSRAAGPEVYCRGDGTVYLCGATDSVPLPKRADEVACDLAETARLLEQARVMGPTMFGEGAKVEKEQACYLPGGPFNGPLIDGSSDHGLFIASGHTCWGITLGPGTGKVMSELLYDGKAISADISKLQA